MGLYRDEAGLVFEMEDNLAASRGYAPVTPTEENQIYTERGLAARANEGAGGAFNAGASRFLSGATLGLTDILHDAVMTPAEREQLLRDIEAHPIVGTAAELGGAILPSLAAPGSALARTPAGYLSSITAREVERGLTRGGIAGTARAVAAMGAEGAVQSAGQYIGHAALENKAATAEGLAGALGTGYAFGAAGGGLGLGVVGGTVAARRMFSRVMDGRKVAQDVESAWSRAAQEALEADRATAATLEARLAEIEKAKIAAQRHLNEMSAMRAEERIRASTAQPRRAAEAAAVADDFVGPEPLIDVGPKPASGGQTTIFKRPEPIGFDGADARAFDEALPGDEQALADIAGGIPKPDGKGTGVFKRLVADEFVGPEPLIDVGPQTGPGGQTAIFKRPEPPVEAAPSIPRTAADVVDEAVTTVPAREIEAHGFESNSVPGKDKVKTERGRKAITEGQRDPITIVVSPSGKYQIDDGTHRLAAAIEAGADVKVKWFKGSKGLDEAAPSNYVVAGKTDLEAKLAGTKAQLDGGKALKDIDGKAIADIAVPGAAVSPQIPQGKAPKPYKGRNPSAEIENMLAEKRAFDNAPPKVAEPPRFNVPKARMSADEMLRRSLELQDLHAVKDHPLPPQYKPTSRAPFSNLRSQLGQKLLPEIRAARTAELLTPEIAAEEAKIIEALDEIQAAREAMKRVDAALTESGDLTADQLAALRQDNPTLAGKKPRQRAMEALDDAHEEALLNAHAATDPSEVGAWLKRAEEVEDLMHSLPDDKDIYWNLGDSIHIVERYEKAIAKAVDAAGDAAHPSAKAIAEAVTKASGDAERRMMERTARAVDDAAEMTPGELYQAERNKAAKMWQEAEAAERARETANTLDQKGPQYMPPKERVRYAAEREVDARRAVNELDVRKTETAGDLKKANAKVKAGERAQKAALKLDAKAATKTAGTAEKLGVLEILDLPGLPKPSDLPVVGPLLGAWLKFRTLRAALGRKMGRVAATADARAAVAASRTRDRIARAIDRSLGLVQRGGATVAHNAPKAAGALSRRIYDDGEPDAKKGAPIGEIAAVRVRELAAYVNTPGAIERDVRRQLAGVTDPDLIAAAEQHRRAAMEYLLKNAPKAPEQGMMQTVRWRPSPAEAMSFARRVEAVHDPAGTWERFAAEHAMLSLEAAEALRTVYPQLFSQAQQRVVEQIATLKKPVAYRTRVQLSLLYQMPLDAALDPDNLKITQSVYERKPAAPAPGMPAAPTPSVAGATNLTAIFQTAADRRAMR